MRVNRSTLRFGFGLAAGLLIAALVAFNALLFWVATGPRSLSALTPMIVSSFSAKDNGFKVTVGETLLLWDGWQHPIDIRLRNVDVLTSEGQIFSSFPEVAVGLHIPSLLLGNILPTSLSIDKPVVSLFQHADRSVSFGFRDNNAETQESTLPFALLFGALSQTDDNGPLRKLRHVYIHQADVSIGSEHDGIVLEATGVDMKLNRTRRNGLEFLINGKLSYDEYQPIIAAHFSMPVSSGNISGKVDFKGLEVSTLVDLFTTEDQPIALSIPISGAADVTLNMDGEVVSARIAAEGGMGIFSTAELETPLKLNWARFDIIIQDKFRSLNIIDLSTDIDGTMLKARGEASRDDKNQFAIKLDASLANVPTHRVSQFWPARLAPITREWVTGNIKEGLIPEATLKTNITFGDLDKPVMPKEAIDAYIRLEGANIHYLPDHPPARNVMASIKIDSVALDAAIDSADYMDATKLSKGRVLIDDLNADNPYIKLSMSADGNTKDTVRFLGLPKLNHAERLNLKPEQTSGKITANAEVGFHFFAPKDESGKTLEPDIAYKVSASMSDVAASGFMRKFDITSATGTIEIDKDQLSYKGSGSVNSAQANSIDVIYLFKPKDGFDTFIKAKAVAGKESLAKFGLGKLDMLQGSLGVQADIKLGPAQEIASLVLDLTPSIINARQIGLSKPEGEPATLELTAEKKSGALKISSFDFKGKGVEARGSLGFDASMSTIQTANLDRLKLGQTSLSKLIYQSAADGFSLSVAGERADLSGLLNESDTSKQNDFSFEKFPAIQLDIDIATLLMAGGTQMNKVKGNLRCSAIRCESADINGSLADKPFYFRIIRDSKNIRQLAIRAENAGEFLKSLSLYDKMEGGVLTINGQYVDSGSSSLLRARVDISEHTIRKAPVLAKILTLASLTGFFDMLEGNGIRFTKMVIPFALQKDVITVSKARAFGNAIGITAEGTINFPAVHFDIKGTVVPSYTANTILGKLPIIGDVLTGGDGKGVFAGNYSVKGTYEDPKVSVNPLSMLTPGVLRGIFDVGSKK